MVIKRVGALSAARIGAVVYAVFGLIFGAFMSIVGMAGAMVAPDEGSGVFGMLFGAAAIVILPVFYGVLGFIGTLVGALLFNAAAGLVGGVEFEVQ